MKIFRHSSLDSTNSECFRKFDRGESVPFSIAAKVQTQGRGQFDRAWYSADAQNLYISFGFVPRQTPQQFQNFSTIVAQNLVEILSHELNLSLEIKLPNDIYGNGKKLGGILTESRIRNGEIAFAATGIGLNVAGIPENFPWELQQIATTLSACCKEKIPLEKIESIVIATMEKLLL
jgi:BirA family biotin operon repressor/biotin-[acetyl-CoA-carboxylase] ligase